MSECTAKAECFVTPSENAELVWKEYLRSNKPMLRVMHPERAHLYMAGSDFSCVEVMLEPADLTEIATWWLTRNKEEAA